MVSIAYKSNFEKMSAYAYQPLNTTDVCTLTLLNVLPNTGWRPVSLMLSICNHTVSVNQRNWVHVNGNDVRAWVAGALESIRRDGPPFSLLITSSALRKQLENMVRSARNDRTRRCMRKAADVDKSVKRRQTNIECL